MISLFVQEIEPFALLMLLNPVSIPLNPLFRFVFECTTARALSWSSSSDATTVKTSGVYMECVWSRAMKRSNCSNIVCVYKSVQHKNCTAIHLGQFSKS